LKSIPSRSSPTMEYHSIGHLSPTGEPLVPAAQGK
jgi:hypothetical protein